jgi:hypothetical protein
MICDMCALNEKPRCTHNLRKVKSIPDKNGIVIIGLKCDDFEITMLEECDDGLRHTYVS